MPLVWIDGQLVDKNDARVNLFDHGFLHGDGIFEGMRIYHGQVFLLQKHLENLRRTAQLIGLKIPQSDVEIREAIQKTLDANPRQEGYVRVIVSRGPGTLALDPRKCESSLFVIVDEIGLYPRELVEAGMHVNTQMVTASLPIHGTLSRGSLVPLRHASFQAGFCESLLFNVGGELIGAIEAVPFFKLPEGWIVPPKGVSDACPVYRELLIELLGTVHEAVISRERLKDAQEAFLTCASAGIVPIDQIEGQSLPCVGPDTAKIRESLRSLIAVPT